VNESDRMKLCELHADMKWVKTTLGNHLKHHEKYEIALVVGILLLVVEALFK
jgi:hypothetical protein